MKRTTLGCRLVRMAARSPGLSITGPEVLVILTPNSLAMMWASEVFPSPGLPWSRTWSRASERALDGSMNTFRFLFNSSWPIYSSRSLGLRLSSLGISSRLHAPSIISSLIQYSFQSGQDSQGFFDQAFKGYIFGPGTCPVDRFFCRFHGVTQVNKSRSEERR